MTMMKAVVPMAPPAAAMPVEPAMGATAPPAVEPLLAPATPASTPSAGVADGSPPQQHDQPQSQCGTIWLHAHSTHTQVPPFT